MVRLQTLNPKTLKPFLNWIFEPYIGPNMNIWFLSQVLSFFALGSQVWIKTSWQNDATSTPPHINLFWYPDHIVTTLSPIFTIWLIV